MISWGLIKMFFNRLKARNADPLQHRLLDQMAKHVAGEVSHDQLNKAIIQISREAKLSDQFGRGGMRKRLAHAASMAGTKYPSLAREIGLLARELSLSAHHLD